MIPISVESVIGAFLLAFPALFSIVNPVGGALIFHEVLAGRSTGERHQLAARVASYALIVILASLWLGSYVLNFFGVSLSALRIAGGLVVAVQAWGLLMQAEVHEERKATAAEPAQGSQDDVAFFPLTMPLTTGPGTIAVAIALSSQRPSAGIRTLAFFGGLSLAAICIALTVWLCYSWADRVAAWLGKGGARIMSRLVAFLLLAIGVQIIITGIVGLSGLLTRTPLATA